MSTRNRPRYTVKDLRENNVRREVWDAYHHMFGDMVTNLWMQKGFRQKWVVMGFTQDHFDMEAFKVFYPQFLLVHNDDKVTFFVEPPAEGGVEGFWSLSARDNTKTAAAEEGK